MKRKASAAKKNHDLMGDMKMADVIALRVPQTTAHTHLLSTYLLRLRALLRSCA